MPASYRTDDGRFEVVRPLIECAEADIAAFAAAQPFPIIPCNLCGSQDNLKRKEVKRMLAEWDKRFPGRVENAFNALSRVTLSHLMDASAFDFAGLRASGVADPGGDIAFDDDPCSADEPATTTTIALHREFDAVASNPD